MTDLATITEAQLPTERQHRPLTRPESYANQTLQIAAMFGLSVGAGLVWPPLFVPAIAGYLLWIGLRSYRHTQGWVRDNDEALALLAANDLDQAEAIFDRLCAAARRLPTWHSVFINNLAVVELQRGEIEHAASMFRAVIREGWLPREQAFAVYFPHVQANLAVCETLLGNVNAAVHWQGRAHASITDSRRGSLLFMDVLLHARRGDDEAVLREVLEGWARGEGLMTPGRMRALRLLQAFALERGLGDQYRAPARSAEIAHSLEHARPYHPGEFDYMVGRWPQLLEFLERHGFVDPDGAGGQAASKQQAR